MGNCGPVVGGAGGESLSVELVDSRGSVIRSQNWPVADADQRIEWDVTARPSGVYLLRATQPGAGMNGQTQTVKVVKP